MPGATVTTLAAVGDGCPDLLVGYRGRNLLLEVKDPNQGRPEYRNRETHRVLTNDQAKWLSTWNGTAVVVWDIDEALRAIGATARGELK